jgi:hypothetical protein
MLQTLDGIRSPLDGFPSPLAARRGGGAAGAYTAAYAANSIDPELVADFVSGFYAQDGAASTFADLFTYTGASLKTMVDSDGVLKWAPHNLLVQSEDCSVSPWSVFDITSRTVVDGYQDTAATRVVVLNNPSGGEIPRLFQTITLTVGVDYTADIISRFVSGTPTSGQVFGIWPGAGVTEGYAAFDSNDTVSDLVAGDFNVRDASVTDLGDGWKRYRVTFTPDVSSFNFNIRFSVSNPQDFTFDVSRPHVYRSDLGGMVDNPDSGDSYVPTTSSAVYMGRTGHHKWNGSAWVNKGVLLESEARTNLITHSEDFTDASWAKSNTATLAVDATGPDGETSAVTLVDSGAGGAGQVRVFQGFTVSASTGYTHSVFAKADQLDYIALRTLGFSSGNGISVFNLSAGTLSEKDVSHDAATIENYGNGWYRCSITFTTDSADTAGSIAIHVLEDESASISDTNLDGTSSILIYGAQLEAVSAVVPYASSYIPTSGATATRAAETLSIAAANMPSYTTAVSIAMAGEVDWADTDSASGEFQFYSWFVDAENRVNAYYQSVIDPPRLVVQQETSNVAEFPSLPSPTPSFGPAEPFAIAVRHGSTFVNIALNGTSGSADTTPTALADLSAEDFDVGLDFTGTIEKVVVWGADIGDTGIEEISA